MSWLEKPLRISFGGAQAFAKAEGMAEPNLPFALVGFDPDAARIWAFPGNILAAKTARTELDLSSHRDARSSNSSVDDSRFSIPVSHASPCAGARLFKAIEELGRGRREIERLN